MDIPNSGGTPTPAAPTSSSPTTPSRSAPAASAVPASPAPAGKVGMAGVTDDAPHQSTAAETVAQKAARKYKIKVDGAEEEIDLDSMTDQDIVEAKQWSKVARKRMEEKANIEKQFRSFVEQVKTDPFAALKDPVFGELDVMKLAEERIIREFQEGQMPPEARQAKDLERQLAAERAKIAQYEAKQQAEIERGEEARIRTHLETVFGEALSKSDLPKTHETMYMMAEVMRAALDAGIELSPEQMAAEVNGKLRSLHGHVTKSLKGDALIKHLGPEVVKEVLNYSIAQARAKTGGNKAPPAAEQKQVTDEEKRERKMQNPTAYRSFFRGK